MEMRKAIRADAQIAWDIRIAAVNSQCAGHYSAETLRAWTEGSLSNAFAEAVVNLCHVATVDGVVVATGMVDLDSGQLDAIFVDPTHARTGVGKRVLQYLESLAIEAGLTQLQLDSTLNAAPFYRAQGYVGDAVGTYNSPRGISLACIPMTKALSRDA